MTQTLQRQETGAAYQITRSDLNIGTVLMLCDAEHIRCRVLGFDDQAVVLSLMDNHLIEGKTGMVLPISELAEHGWRLETEPKKSMQIDPSEIRPGAILGSPVHGIRCRVDSVEHGRAKLSVLDNNAINGDKQVTVAINHDLLTGWHLLKKAA